ncbi:hypothetical protein BAE44_0023580 [Dichanthelium oligosanthes]|uniref:DUF1618 domain-containing protein n=1 Tax=Dichanthelium oligosanthes TaxID=888268 RepID=A0A1E5UR78_9POAL|nr:hypothetical protein BAE44_0023580 [Dichanthelium oligosanthes]
MSNLNVGRAGRSRPSLPPPALARALLSCFAPPPLPPLPPWIVLDSSLDVHLGVAVPPVGLEREEWALVECAGRTAYGCGERGQQVLHGLTLFVRLVRPGCVTTALYIHATDDVLRAIRAEYGDGDGYGFLIPMDSLGLGAQGTVKTAEDSHIVLAVSFRLQYLHSLSYYVVYDALDRSLAMIPCTPEPNLCPTHDTFTPLTVPRDGGTDPSDHTRT